MDIRDRLATTVNTALRRTTGYQVVRAAASPARAAGPAAAGRRGAASPARRSGGGVPERVARRILSELEGVENDRLSLTEIANLEGTDKGTIGPSPDWPAHNYTDVYEAYLSPLRDHPITILEVGLGVPGDAWEARIAHGRNEGGGGSVRTWYRYFPKAQILGADINPATHLDNDRVRTFRLDQGSEESIGQFLDQLGDLTFDVVVDDGSHRPDHQQITLGCLFPRVSPGGLYIIEDLLKNGRGDGRQTRMSSDSVLNTRRVLKQFRRNGTFAEPHAIVDPDYVAAHIQRLAFHVPGRRLLPDTESVCVIRKV